MNLNRKASAKALNHEKTNTNTSSNVWMNKKMEEYIKLQIDCVQSMVKNLQESEQQPFYGNAFENEENHYGTPEFEEDYFYFEESCNVTNLSTNSYEDKENVSLEKTHMYDYFFNKDQRMKKITKKLARLGLKWLLANLRSLT